MPSAVDPLSLSTHGDPRTLMTEAISLPRTSNFGRNLIERRRPCSLDRFYDFSVLYLRAARRDRRRLLQLVTTSRRIVVSHCCSKVHKSQDRSGKDGVRLPQNVSTGI